VVEPPEIGKTIPEIMRLLRVIGELLVEIRGIPFIIGALPAEIRGTPPRIERTPPALGDLPFYFRNVAKAFAKRFYSHDSA
jgi:hypothetical protein